MRIRNKASSRFFVSAAALWTALGSVASAGEPLPTGEQVLNRYVEVTGGRAAYEKIRNRVTVASFEMASMGIKGKFVLYSAAPNKTYSSLEPEGMGPIEEGTDGKTFWLMHPRQGPRIKEGAEKWLSTCQSVFNTEMHWDKVFSKVQCLSVQKEDQLELYKVALIPPKGKPIVRYYDKKTGLLVREEVIKKKPSGAKYLTITFDDYRPVGDLLLPHLIIRNAGEPVVYRTESIRHNVEIPKDRFGLPPEIKRLLPGHERGGEDSAAKDQKPRPDRAR